MNKGKIIVLEGLDGCGKSTQLQLLFDSMSTVRSTRLISFPNYDSSTGRVVSDYLSGKIPCDGAAGAYAASGFYAGDRYASFVSDWKRDYEAGSVIISGRYTTSNAIYQMTKLPREEWDGYLEWLWDYEYNRLGLPEPDMVLFLDMPIEVSQKLLSERYNGDESKKDIHESNVAFLRACRESALYTAQRCGWRIIPCSDGENPLSIEEISLKIKRETEGI
ncbi:MAG: dTMP kinase [Oscillospiraceae bacterium]